MKLKSISEILSNLIDRTLVNTHELNDFSVGSTILSIYESVSMELEQYYVLGRDNILWGIEEGIYEAFDFPRKPARRAYGNIIVEFHTVTKSGLYIARGSSFHSSVAGYKQVFETLEDYLVPAGVSVANLTVYCTQSGIIGNIPRNIINTNANNISNVKKIYNPGEFLTGQDQESLDKVKQRFREFVETRGRATNRAIAYGVREVQDVAGVYVQEEVGRIKVYAHDLNGELSDVLKEDIIKSVESYRPSGVKLEVAPIEKKSIDLTIQVTIKDKTAKTDSFKNEITRNITNYLNSMTVSDDLILADIVQRIMNIDDYLIYDVKIQNLQTNGVIEDYQLIRAGTIAITLE